MALWVCLSPECGAAYSVDAPKCPQCGSTEHREDSEQPESAAPAKSAPAKKTTAAKAAEPTA
jgi:ribosomal protein L40E